jgi:phosphoribosylformylglycinamidine (FGAM) synthase-like amidotransferase family enzyme
MEGSILPIAVAHGEGRVVASEADIASLNAENQVACVMLIATVTQLNTIH